MRIKTISLRDNETMAGDSILPLASAAPSGTLCLLCTIQSYLLCSCSSSSSTSPTQVQFDLEGGYDFLETLLIELFTTTDPHSHSEEGDHQLPTTCKDCLVLGTNHSAISTLEAETGGLLFSTERETRITFFVLSLLFNREVDPTLLLHYLDCSLAQTLPQRGQTDRDSSLRLTNLRILRIILKFIEQEDSSSPFRPPVSLFGLSLLELILRLNPLSVIGIQVEGGLFVVQKLLISSIFVSSLHPSPHEEMTPLLFPQRADRSRSSSSGTSSTSVPSISTDSVKVTLTQQEYRFQLEKALSCAVLAIQLLVRMSVILSARNSSILNLFVIIAQLVAQRLNPLSSSWRPQEKCSNCEAEVAEYECTHHRSSPPNLPSPHLSSKLFRRWIGSSLQRV
jgi:hypothetical protein